MTVGAQDNLSGGTFEVVVQDPNVLTQILTITANGEAQVSVTQPLPAGTNIVGNVRIDQTTPGTTNGVQVNASLPSGANIIGNVRIDQTTPGTTNGVQVNAALPTGANVIGAVTQSGTWTVQQGTPPWSASQSGTWNVGLNTGSNIVGRVGIDQTTPGTTNLVSVTPVGGYKATYSASATALVFAASATDVFTIYGSGSKTIRVTYVSVSFTSTSGSGAAANVTLAKRSTANTGGTSSVLTAVPHDSTSSAGTATVRSYTANPTLGTLVGNIRAIRDARAVANDANPYFWEFGIRPSQSPVLRGTGEGLAINLGATTITGSIASLSVEWTEE